MQGAESEMLDRVWRGYDALVAECPPFDGSDLERSVRLAANVCCWRVAAVGDDLRSFLVASITCWKSLRFPSLW